MDGQRAVALEGRGAGRTTGCEPTPLNVIHFSYVLTSIIVRERCLCDIGHIMQLM